MAQQARSVSDTNLPPELHVLGVGPAQGGSFPEDFVAAVEQRSAMMRDDPVVYPEDDPWHRRVPKSVAIAAAAFAAGILVVAGIMATGDGTSPRSELAVAANANEQQATEPGSTAGQDQVVLIANGDALASAAGLPEGEAGAVARDRLSLPALAAFGDLSIGDLPAPTQLNNTFGELGFLNAGTTADVADAPSVISDVVVPPIPEDEPASAIATIATEITLASAEIEADPQAGVSDDQLAHVPGSDDAVAAVDVAAAVDGLSVQLASYGSEQRAQTGWNSLLTDHADVFTGLNPVIEKAELDTGTFYRLRIGAFASSSEAGQFCSALSDRQVSCIVVPR